MAFIAIVLVYLNSNDYSKFKNRTEIQNVPPSRASCPWLNMEAENQAVPLAWQTEADC